MHFSNKYFYPRENLAKKLYQLSDASYEFGSPWTQKQFKEDIINERSHYLMLVDQEIIAYLCYHQLFNEAELFNIAICKKVQRKGHASTLLCKLNQILVEEQVDRIFLEVRQSNTSAQKFYENSGFNYLSSRKRYYSDPVEDALVMVKKVRSERNNGRIDFSN